MMFPQLSLAGLASSILAIVFSLLNNSASVVNNQSTTVPCARPCFSGSRVSSMLAPSPNSGVADFDNDGRLDFAARSGFGGSVWIQRGLGNGLFGDPEIVDANVSGFSLLTGDFNNDGATDIFTPGKLYLGNGNGTFSAPIPLILSASANNYSIGDFNGDDNLDVVGSTFSNSSLQIFYGNGTNGFSGPTTVTFSSAAGVPETADLNGDGISDVAVLLGTGTISVAFGKPDNTFQMPVNYPLGGTTEIGTITSGDIDSDGDQDIVGVGVASNGSQSYRAVLTNNGNGSFSVQTTSGPGTGQQFRVFLGDVNSDGALDLVNNQGALIVVSLGNNNGTFQQSKTFPSIGSQGKIFLDDFTGDGIRDLAFTSGSVASFSVVPIDAAGNMGAKQLDIEDQFFSTSVVSADFNEDGKTDVLWANDTVNMKIALGDGNGGFASITTLAAPKVPRAAVTADINNDGHQDIFLIGQNSGESEDLALIAYGNGNGTFQPFFTAVGVAPQAALHPLLSDLNGDGFVDMVLQDSNSHRVYIVQNVGNGLFAFRGSIDVGSTVGGTTAGDFDGDGRIDLAILSGGVSIYLNRGDWNNWDAAGFFPAGNANANVITSDLNHDGVLDLVAAVTSGTGSGAPPGKIEVLLGVGKGGFGAPHEYTVGYGPKWMGIADFDGDGNPDLAVSNSGSGINGDTRVAVLYGDGSGNFPQTRYSAAATQPRELIAADINSDGRQDIAVVDYNQALLTLLVNECLPMPSGNFPTIAANTDVTLNEGDVTDTNATLTVTLSAPSTVAVRVKYYTAPQIGLVSLTQNELFEAQASSDYKATSGELVFMPGQTSKTIPIIVTPDLIDEYDEKFNVFLRNATNATIADNRTVITIVDNDAPPVVTIGNVSAPESNAGTIAFDFPITLSSVSGKPVTLTYQTGGGTATVNQDYVSSQGAFTVPAGQLSAPLSITVNGDLTWEPDETFFTEISEPLNATIGNSARGTGTIQNDDVAGNVQFSSSTYGTPENTGVTITVTRTGGNAGGVSVKFRTAAGTAQPGQDYSETSTTVIFGDNEVSKNVFIPIIPDQLDEPDETVNLILEQPNGVTLGDPSTAVLTIQGTSNLPNLSISDTGLAEGDNGISYMQFYLRLSRPVQREVSVNYSTADGTATAGVDYASISGTATMAPGMTRKVISVPIYGDFLPETDETLFLNLSGVVNAVLTDNQAVGRILNDEISTSSAVQLLSIDPANAAGGNNDSYEPQISRNGRVAAFESYAGNLSTIDTNGVRDIYARNISAKTTALVSVNRFGTAAGNAGAVKPVLSGDGRFVAFNSASSDLVPEGVSASGSVFLRDLQTNTTRIVSVNNAGNPANGDIVGLSTDGRYVTFQSRDQDLTSIPDTQTFNDVFVRDMQANVTTLVSVNSAGNGPGNADSGGTSVFGRLVSISSNGRFVLFPSTSTNLVTQPGPAGLYVRDLQTQTTSAVCVNTAGTAQVGCVEWGSMSDDGRYAFFISADSTLAPNDTNNALDVFRRDMQTGVISLVSVNAAGNGPGDAGSGTTAADAVSSADGRYVAFTSNATNLTGLNINGVTQVYWRDLTSGVTKMVSLNSAGTAGGDGTSSRIRMSADGSTVVFTTISDDIVAGVDRNSLLDIYERDMFANVTKLVSSNQYGTSAGNLGADSGSVSGDGNIIGFASSSSDIVPIDTNGFGADAYAFIKTLPPLPIADFDGDGKTDFSVFRPSSAVWYILNSSDNSFRAQSFGLNTDLLVHRDYDGDGKTDIAVFRAGIWYVFNSRTSTVSVTSFGQAGDLPVPGDYDGDLRADFAVYHQGTWQIRESSDGNVMTQQFGLPGDVPTNADYDGDRRDDIAVFRDGIWYILQSSDLAVRINQFGSPGDKPIQGDFDGDQKTDLAVFRPSIGAWYIAYSATNTVLGTQFGISTDEPLHADFDGDGKADIAVFRDGTWYVTQSSNGSVIVGQFGLAGDKPLPQ